MVRFTGISDKQAQAIEVLKKHIFLPDVEVAVAQSDQASISIKGEGCLLYTSDAADDIL